MLRRNLTQILSCVYAVFIVTLGVVVYISSLVAGKSPILAEVGAAGFCFGHLVHSSLLLAYQAMFLIQDPDEFSKCASPATLVLDILYPVYSFLQLFFIFKYSNVNARLLILVASGPINQTLTLSTPHSPPPPPPLQVIINRCEELARFALMHCLASSLCFWVWTILRETMDSLAHYDHQDAPHEHLEQPEDVLLDYDTDYPAAPLAAPLGSTHAPTAGTGPVAMPLTTYHKRTPRFVTLFSERPIWKSGALDLVKFMNASSLGSSECRASTQLSTVLDSLSPYLYPFTIEYSILVVGVLFVIWQNIGNCSNAVEEAAEADGKVSSAASTSSASSTASSRGSTASLCRPPPMSPQSGFVSNVVLHADCHSANKGLFAGLIVLYMEVGLTVNSVTELTLLALMTVAVMAAYCRLAKLDVVRRSSASVSLLDHLLLFLCIPAFFLYAIFSIVPALEQRSYLSITTILLQVTQVLVQTPFIMDGMRRCSNCVKLRLQKPGRELVTFLIVCNVALWITDTFEIKSVDARDHRADYYGRVLWTMISHATVPLTMLYRFHSSGCLVHIWKSAYEADRLH
ncbi:hypothetical protein FOCC_FOCC000164 [Frankliniella occidentalis]|nr:hypothetical protein FOCC_FOCC000164 [Frankliniella occidentalis]